MSGRRADIQKSGRSLIDRPESLGLRTVKSATLRRIAFLPMLALASSLMTAYPRGAQAIDTERVLVSSPQGLHCWAESISDRLPGGLRPGDPELGNADAVAVPLWIAGIPTNATVRAGFAVAAPPQDQGSLTGASSRTR